MNPTTIDMTDTTRVRAPKPKTDREFLTPSQRFGELVAMFVMCLFIAYFVYHQVAETGFFTTAFGPPAMFFFYGPLLLALLAPMTRAVVGRRNPARPLEVITDVFLAIAAAWLLIIFPFDFTRLADALPSGIRFLLGWVNNDIGRVVLVIQMIVCPIVALVTAWIFISHLRREPRDTSTVSPAS